MTEQGKEGSSRRRTGGCCGSYKPRGTRKDDYRTMSAVASLQSDAPVLITERYRNM